MISGLFILFQTKAMASLTKTIFNGIHFLGHFHLKLCSPTTTNMLEERRLEEEDCNSSHPAERLLLPYLDNQQRLVFHIMTLMSQAIDNKIL